MRIKYFKYNHEPYRLIPTPVIDPFYFKCSDYVNKGCVFSIEFLCWSIGFTLFLNDWL